MALSVDLLSGKRAHHSVMYLSLLECIKKKNEATKSSLMAGTVTPSEEKTSQKVGNLPEDPQKLSTREAMRTQVL